MKALASTPPFPDFFSLFVRAVVAGALSVLVVKFVMDPLALATMGATFAAPSIYAFMAKSLLDLEVGLTAGTLIHWAVFCVVVPLIWSAASRGTRRTAKAVLAFTTAIGFWVFLMSVLMPLAGLPPFYNFNQTTIWSGVAFAILGTGLSVVAILPNGERT
ncbi:hypothetical protein [Cognatishimia maritima]|uniref:Uncharacterized protein n=1 Tax=Cognatishimia maritima TaxID=870908 RepID=A0A1M5VZY8_9RHOB|nr:hypothetical protein [Cognatishimia maritima]SHH80781.1 hypothetical protein SAMN04488044_3335 [Cognatishimia maritima]